MKCSMKRNSCKCSNRRNSLKNLISDYKNLHTEQKTLQKKQTAYLALAQAADEQLQDVTVLIPQSAVQGQTFQLTFLVAD